MRNHKRGLWSVCFIYVMKKWINISKWDHNLYKTVKRMHPVEGCVSLNDSTHQTRKKKIYFTSKALFVFKKITF